MEFAYGPLIWIAVGQALPLRAVPQRLAGTMLGGAACRPLTASRIIEMEASRLPPDRSMVMTQRLKTAAGNGAWKRLDSRGALH